MDIVSMVAMLIFGILILFVSGLAFILISTKKSIFGAKYPIQVEIIEERAGNKVRDTDWARRVSTSEKGVILELKKRKKQLPPIPLNYIYLDKQGKSYLYLYTPDNEKFFPIKIETSTENEPKFLEEKAWDIVDYRTAVKLKDLFHEPSFMQKYGNIVFFLIAGFLTIMLIYIVFGKTAEIISIQKESIKIASENLKISKEISRALIQALSQISKEKGTAIVSNITQAPPPY